MANLVKHISRDIPILLVEHDIDRVFALADRVTVMNEGRVLVDGTADDARNSSAVQQVYIGGGAAARTVTSRDDASARTSAAAHARDAVDAYYGKSHIVQGASLILREREFVALLGRNGAGKSTLLKTIIGIVRAGGGRITLGDDELTALPAATIARLGIGYVPQGRGLFAGMSVRDNLELGSLKRRSGSGDRLERSSAFSNSSRDSSHGSTPRRTSSRAASSRWSPWRVRCRAMCGCCCSTSRSKGSRRRWSTNCSTRSTSCETRSSMVIVEHNLDLVLALADRAYVLERGSVVYEGRGVRLCATISNCDAAYLLDVRI